MVEGLWGQDTVSFESVTDPGRFLCNKNGLIVVVQRGELDQEDFLRGCSFKLRENK